mmetsp:Transcript_10222/g.23225  ORF Transcript_10222/g.23225 Transcript_10222/m.23225 type:complete len:89 (+) Transcript_10222:1575-1841(+)
MVCSIHGAPAVSTMMKRTPIRTSIPESSGRTGPRFATLQKNDVVALIIPFGGHHTDLMYSSESDPKCVTEGRNAEEAFIGRWINDWNQ